MQPISFHLKMVRTKNSTITFSAMHGDFAEVERVKQSFSDDPGRSIWVLGPHTYDGF